MKRARLTKIIVSLLLAVMLSVYAGSSGFAAEGMTGAEKTVHTHDIAIVFDNSGSMYTDTRWSQAIYAMEVFAAMMNYENDKLGIYPMEKICIGKDGNTIDGRMEISGRDDVMNIEKIYSPEGADTILKPAYDAYDYLKSSNLDEKWLIILTDGAFTKDKDPKEEGISKDAGWLKGKIEENFLIRDDINVQYLGFAEASNLSGNESRHFYASNASSAEALTNELVTICNKIFKRNVVSDVASDGSFDIDVSMNSIVAFAQGNGAKINSLTGPDGKKVKEVMDTKLDAPKEGTGFSDPQKWPDIYMDYPAPAADVSGQVVTFDSCAAGTYKLDYSGSNVQVFYEPSVYVSTVLTDKNGEKVDLSKEVEPGDYTLSYGLVDAVTGEDVTNSPLLSPVSLNAQVANGGSSESIASGGTVNLQPDDHTQIDVSGTFLNDYKISNAGENGVFEINVAAPPLRTDALSIKIDIQNRNSGKKWYKLKDHEKWLPIRVEVSYEGEHLTREQMDKALSLSFKPEDKELKYRVEPLYDESAYNIYIGEDENGEYVEPKKGTYKLDATATVSDEFGRDITAKAFDRFKVSSMDGFWEWLMWLLILAALGALIFVVLNLPAWPAKMNCRITAPRRSEGNYPIQIGTNMTLIPYKYPLSCNARKASKLMHKFSKKAQIVISDITVHRKVESFTIGTKTYTRQNQFKDGQGKPFSGIITSGKTIKMTFNGAPPLQCKIDIN